MTLSVAIATLALGIWIYLIFLHGNFWLADEREEDSAPDLKERLAECRGRDSRAR